MKKFISFLLVVALVFSSAFAFDFSSSKINISSLIHYFEPSSDEIQGLIDLGFDVNGLDSFGSDAITNLDQSENYSLEEKYSIALVLANNGYELSRVNLSSLIYGYEPEVGVIKYLLNSGSDANAIDSYGDDSLTNVFKYSSYSTEEKSEIVSALVNSGYDLSKLNLSSFVYNYEPSLSLIAFLVESGIDVNARDSYGDDTLINIFAYSSYSAEEKYEIAKILLDSGYDVSRLNLSSIIYSLEPEYEAIEYLVSKGIDVNARDSYGDDAIENLYEYTDYSEEERYEIAYLLLNAGYDISRLKIEDAVFKYKLESEAIKFRLFGNK